MSGSELRLWRDMTDVEKGALLLAAHEGRGLEYWRRGSGGWATCSSAGIYDNEAYRIRPEPKVKAVEFRVQIYENGVVRMAGVSNTHRITFSTIDGEPDCASIKMEKLCGEKAMSDETGSD